MCPGLVGKAVFLVATGSHEPPTDPQLRSILGDHFEAVRHRVHSHRATHLNSMIRVGSDPLGGDVYLNRMVLDYERVVVIGSVEPHYFAGYTGGRKALFPGLIDLATIERNHNLANSHEAAPLRLKGNPVAEHLESLLGSVDQRRFLSIQLVVDAQGQIAGVYAGNLESSFRRAVAKADELFARSVVRPFDMVLCEVRPPIDRNMYQAQKGLENCQAGVIDGGTAVVIAKCVDGVGSDFFFRQAGRWDRANNRPADGVYQFGSHKLTRMVALQRRVDVRLYSSLPDSIVEHVFYRPAGNLSELIRTKASGQNNFRIGVVLDAGNTVLKVTAS
jgi:nickel-dependent lactate racemase